jgi:cystathionine beta-synthase
MNYRQSVLELIGNTPLVKINRINKGLKPLILAKMENLNPGFSVKDRIGISMIKAAEGEGKLKPGGTIVEATSGNTGIALAMVCAVKGYKCIFVMTDKASVEKSRYLKAGAMNITPVSQPARRIIASLPRAESRRRPNSFYPDQYSHPANPELTIARLVRSREQTEGRSHTSFPALELAEQFRERASF